MADGWDEISVDRDVPLWVKDLIVPEIQRNVSLPKDSAAAYPIL